MYKYLPSKKFIYAVGAIILSLFLALGANWLADRKNASGIDTPKVAEQRVEAQKFLAIDSDEDGLKDWEESLWKTDPKTTDTDKDGSTDGEEVSLDRNPTQANTAKFGQQPNDLIDAQLIADQKKQEEDFLALTQTEQVSRTLFSQYLAAKGNQTISNTDIQIILDTAVASLEQANIKKYNLTDLKTLTIATSSTIKTYGNQVGRAFFTGTTKTGVIENELLIIDRALTNNDETTLRGLDPLIEGYGNTIKKLLLIEVPTSATGIHLSLVNDLTTLKYSLEGFKQMFSDPAKGMAALQYYQTATSNLILDIGKMKNYLIGSGASFTKDEYGYFLVNIL